MMIDEAIHLEPYDEQWAALFRDEYQTLIRQVGEFTVAIEHFGSTSVPGMTAKPIIDILVGIGGADLADKIIPGLVDLGYEFLGEAGIPGRLYLRKRGTHAYNVHIVHCHGDIWNHNIILRDYLRSHHQEAQRYSDAKRQIVTQGARTLLHYSDEKNEFVGQLLDRAKAWARSNEA